MTTKKWTAHLFTASDNNAITEREVRAENVREAKAAALRLAQNQADRLERCVLVTLTDSENIQQFSEVVGDGREQYIPGTQEYAARQEVNSGEELPEKDYTKRRSDYLREETNRLGK